MRCGGGTSLARYYQLCHILSSAPSALALWGEAVVRAEQLQPSATITSANLTLVDLLFRQGRDEEVVEVYQALQPLLAEHRANTDHLVLAMALLAICRCWHLASPGHPPSLPGYALLLATGVLGLVLVRLVELKLVQLVVELVVKLVVEHQWVGRGW